jgi:hypothetical protein
MGVEPDLRSWKHFIRSDHWQCKAPAFLDGIDLTQTPKLEATDRLEHWLLNASRSLDSILKDAAAADRKALSHQASAPLNHLELRN